MTDVLIARLCPDGGFRRNIGETRVDIEYPFHLENIIEDLGFLHDFVVLSRERVRDTVVGLLRREPRPPAFAAAASSRARQIEMSNEPR